MIRFMSHYFVLIEACAPLIDFRIDLIFIAKFNALRF